MSVYSKIDQVASSLQFGNVGLAGWGFSAYSLLSDQKDPHRRLLDGLVAVHPEILLDLPDASNSEDFVEGSMKWGVHDVHVYFETTLSYVSFWSSDRKAVDVARTLVAQAASSM